MKADKFYPDVLYYKANAAGMAAVEKCVPVPMVVVNRANPLDDNSSVVNRWVVPDGPCGFAWVNIKPGNCAFAKYLKDKGLARKDSYYGGVSLWVSYFNQSMAKKEAYAYAFAKVVSEAGIKCYANSRMD
jgi:hypothetical protein